MKTPATRVALAGGIVAAIVMLALLGDELPASAKLVIITTLLGQIPSILALRAAETISHDIRNGMVTEKVKDAVNELAADPETPVMVIGKTDD